MDIFLDILIGLSLIAVLASFFMGMIFFAQNGEVAAERSNTFMAWRVRTQVVSIGVLLLSLWYKAAHP